MASLKFWVRTLARWACLPWVGVMFARFIIGPRPHFGFFWRGHVGPDLKLINLSKRFGNSWLAVNIVYVVSGVALPVIFLKWAKFWGAKIILNQNGVPNEKHLVEKLRKIHRLADHVIYQSRFCAEQSNLFIHPTREKPHILYNAVDSRWFFPAVKKNRCIRVLAKRPGFSYRETYPFSEEPIIFIDDMDDFDFTNARMPLLYKIYDIFLDCKVNDPCPNSVLEAMACGLPVIYHNSGGTPELVGDAGVPLLSLAKPDIIKAIVEVIGDYAGYSERARSRAVREFEMTDWIYAHVILFHVVSAPDVIGGPLCG